MITNWNFIHLWKKLRYELYLQFANNGQFGKGIAMCLPIDIESAMSWQFRNK